MTKKARIAKKSSIIKILIKFSFKSYYVLNSNVRMSAFNFLLVVTAKEL